ncbi:hypothetical protein IM697_27070 [Streptomyces ferrugineus]|uniref:Uncharacterized protein n=1 Tax=Streptomyces ferrugineus TaxID=1413221 RepID=A0A7M2SDI9_9ACTN|nr:hypothetical protein [Streptomyces ferrugineus]QOV33845.1 hypothetical protein IM697_27070 [Streptomyces ferrugineus]
MTGSDRLREVTTRLFPRVSEQGKSPDHQGSYGITSSGLVNGDWIFSLKETT